MVVPTWFTSGPKYIALTRFLALRKKKMITIEDNNFGAGGRYEISTLLSKTTFKNDKKKW